MASTKKNGEVRFRASNKDRKRLAALCKRGDSNPSDVLRRLLLDETNRLAEHDKTAAAHT